MWLCGLLFAWLRRRVDKKVRAGFARLKRKTLVGD
jgi:hypothetical protein